MTDGTYPTPEWPPEGCKKSAFEKRRPSSRKSSTLQSSSKATSRVGRYRSCVKCSEKSMELQLFGWKSQKRCTHLLIKFDRRLDGSTQPVAGSTLRSFFLDQDQVRVAAFDTRSINVDFALICLPFPPSFGARLPARQIVPSKVAHCLALHPRRRANLDVSRAGAPGKA